MKYCLGSGSSGQNDKYCNPERKVNAENLHEHSTNVKIDEDERVLNLF